jgi:uncharacterized membrane protein YkoI
MSTSHALPVALAALLLVGCTASPDEDAASVELESSETPNDAAADGTGDGSTGDGGTGDDDADDPDPALADEDGADEDGTGDADLVDLAEAVPGTWPVGDAGTVTFALDGGALVLEDVSAADGWTAEVDEEDPDEIEVDFRRGDVEWEIEIEITDDGDTLEIEIDQDVENAPEGSYDMGDAGSFAIGLRDGRLVLTDLAVADSWTVTERDEEGDEIELEVRDGARVFDVEVELDDGGIEVEIDYEVSGPLPA